MLNRKAARFQQRHPAALTFGRDISASPVLMGSGFLPLSGCNQVVTAGKHLFQIILLDAKATYRPEPEETEFKTSLKD